MSENPPSSPQGRQRLLLWTLLPLAPIVIAVGIALSAKYFYQGTPAANPARPQLAAGDLAPDFTLPDAHQPDGENLVTLSLSTQKSPVLLIFILGYNCSKCTAYLAEYDLRASELARLGVQIVAVTPDTLPNLRDSISTYGDFSFAFLSDADTRVARAYGLREDPAFPLHGLFLIDGKRRIALAAATDHPYTDFDEVFAAARKLQGK
jgi:peroxiredoxin